jgi:hypothetical protein
MNLRIRSFAIPALAFAAALVLAACGGEGERAEPVEEVASASLGSDELKLKLASADALDGQTDQVVELCSGCRLGMSGKAEHPITVDGYTLHMCSEACKAAFSKDLAGNLAALEIPQS